jgi:hypothetical protein
VLSEVQSAHWYSCDQEEEHFFTIHLVESLPAPRIVVQSHLANRNFDHLESGDHLRQRVAALSFDKVVWGFKLEESHERARRFHRQQQRPH